MRYLCYAVIIAITGCANEIAPSNVKECNKIILSYFPGSGSSQIITINIIGDKYRVVVATHSTEKLTSTEQVITNPTSESACEYLLRFISTGTPTDIGPMYSRNITYCMKYEYNDGSVCKYTMYNPRVIDAANADYQNKMSFVDTWNKLITITMAKNAVGIYEE